MILIYKNNINCNYIKGIIIKKQFKTNKNMSSIDYNLYIIYNLYNMEIVTEKILFQINTFI